ncbi:glycosyltransferase [Oceanobacillus piezotolerans]|uniref:Glycosyltransferase n=1 Tax=Oceanobacillus piezotolerans TaxID=2448030 RepID=A0A498DMJ4_9BACI|nr:glycosyltransferase family 2 protein [Oceanobacillus piezotolerans]RLL48270.1 glycosyltransferase [Oceanobacillus piezotolerans]
MDIDITALVHNVNFFTFLLFAAFYSYQIFYMFVALFKGKRQKNIQNQSPLNKYAVIIAARNEELVIGHLIDSIKKQKYPKDLVDVFVVADNCTDNTAQVSRDAGAIVIERFNLDLIGKGYALDYLFHIIDREYASKQYQGYFVFDADNLLDENYLAEMNKTFNSGYRVVTSYRNSKNYDQNWISAGYGLWFLHEAEYLNLPRMTLNTSCAISGTGFLVHSDLIRKNGGWIHHLLTEDIEFSVSQIIKGEKIGYCRNAVFYDEQPVTFEQSWNQRLRWAKGFYQVFSKYGKDLVRHIFKGKRNRFSCFDMTMTIMPAMLISCFTISINLLFYLAGIAGIFDSKEIIQATSAAMFKAFGWYYGILYILGLITTISEWKKIHCSSWKKIWYTVTFPLFMFTYIPIALVALFRDVEWKPIAHTVVKSMDDVR